MESIYKVWITVYPLEKLPDENKYRWGIIQVLNHLVILTQNIQFFWNFDLPVNNWKKYEPFWNTINMPSFDVIAVRYNLIPQYLIFEVLVLGVVLLSLILVCLLNTFEKHLPKSFLCLLQILLTFQCELSFIPTSIFFLIIFKYSQSSKLTHVVEYPNNLSSKIFNYGTTGQFLSISMVAFLLILTMLYELCSYTIKHSSSTSNTANKITAKCCILNKIIYFCNSYMFISFQLTNYQAFLIVSILLYGLSSVFLIANLPFYSFKMNFIKIFVHLDCFVLGIIFLSGFYFDNSGVITLLSVSMQIFICPLIYSLINWRMSKILPINISMHHKFSIFELAIRENLYSGGLNEVLLEKLISNYNFYEEPINCLTQAYYADEVMKNPMLGLNIITKIYLSGLNISINYQAYRCKCYLMKKVYRNSNSIKIIEYFNSLSSTKENDKKFCRKIYKFINQLQSEEFLLSDLKYSTNELVKYYKIVKKQYKDIYYNNPDAIEVKNYYESFLLKLLGDTNYKTKSFISHKNNENLDKLSAKSYAFQSRRCFFIASCDLDNFGKIVHYNNNFQKFLAFKSDSGKELYVESLIVSDFCKNPHKAMRNFIEKTLTHQALVNAIVPLLSSEGYLCESLINSELISYKNTLNFICSVDPLIYKKREIALLNNFGVIIGHSKNFPKLLGFDSGDIVGESVSEILIGINYSELCEDKIFPIKKPLNQCFYSELNGVLKKKSLGKLQQLILYVTDSDEELMSWRNNYEDFYCEKEYNDSINHSCESNTLNSYINAEKDQDDMATMGLDSLNKMSKGRTIESFRSDIKTIPTFELKSLKKAVFVLNLTKIVLLLSVILI